MSKSKIDFISDLLVSKKLEASQKERLFRLAANELKKNGETDERIFAEIEAIKNQLKGFTENIQKREEKTEKERVLIHKPKDVADFMYLFNKRDGFKYLTHDYDGEGKFEIEVFLKNAKELFDIQTKKLSIPKDLYAIVNQFAFSDKPEWGNKTKQGFSLQKWINWSKENNLSPIRNKGFEAVINKFRNLTRVESPDLKKIIDDLKSDIFRDLNFDITLNRLDKADFYTNTNTFKTAIKSIFEVIYKKRKIAKGSNKLSIEYKGLLVDNYYEVQLIITHFNSYPTKDFEQLLEEWRGYKGAIGEIKAKLFGYCDWSIETRLEGGCYRINLLKEDSTPDFEKIDCKIVDGTKHILKYYYKTSD